MKKIAIISVLMALLLANFVACTDNDIDKDGDKELDKINATIDTWTVPEAYEKNDAYKVEVSSDGSKWSTLEVYNALNGHQKGDPLLTSAGILYFGEPNVSSLAVFDFTGTVGVRVTYNDGTLTDGGYVLSPDSYNLKSVQDKNTVTFTMTQNETSPRKVVFRPEGKWEAECLHIMTNTPEDEYKVKETDENVFVIGEGEEIPLYLPQGKDTYYFKKGIHNLPGGYWVEIDLGMDKQISRFDLTTMPHGEFQQPGGVCFEIQARKETETGYAKVYESVGEGAEQNYGDITGDLNISARYVRLILKGNFSFAPVNGYRFLHKAMISELKLMNADNENLAAGKAVKGSDSKYTLVTDGSTSSGYFGNVYAGETFSALSGYTYYMEKGSVVYGSMVAEGAENITLSGRGIFDGIKLLDTHELSEGRNGSIRFENCKNVVVEGLTIMNAPMWMVVINHSENVVVDGINLFGKNTNADGIHFSASKNAVAKRCFIRTTDDLFVAYHYGDADGLTFKDSVLWSDGGRVLLIGLADSGDIKNVTLENCDVITYQNTWNIVDAGGFAMIVASGKKTIENVVIKDIRIDEVRSSRIAQFMQIRVGFGSYGTGYIDGVSLENITFKSGGTPKSLISAVIPGGKIENVKFKDVNIAGTKLSAENLREYFNHDPDISVAFN